MKKIKTQLNVESFPKEIQAFFAGAEVYDSSCHSQATVYYLDTGYYVKTDAPFALKAEATLNRLFDARGLGVEVAAYVTADRDYMVTRSAIGQDLTHFLDNPKKLCALLAEALRKLHAQPIDGFPLSSRQQRYLDSAAGDENGGYYDPSVRMDRYPIKDKAEAWSMMQKGKHCLDADVLIHGDACLPNVIQKDGAFSTFIDFNMAGIGDRHIDLYWAIWSLQYNLGTDAYTDLFLDLYGREYVNEETLRLIAAFELFG